MNISSSSSGKIVVLSNMNQFYRIINIKFSVSDCTCNMQYPILHVHVYTCMYMYKCMYSSLVNM